MPSWGVYQPAIHTSNVAAELVQQFRTTRPWQLNIVFTWLRRLDS